MRILLLFAEGGDVIFAHINVRCWQAFCKQAILFFDEYRKKASKKLDFFSKTL